MNQASIKHTTKKINRKLKAAAIYLLFHSYHYTDILFIVYYVLYIICDKRWDIKEDSVRMQVQGAMSDLHVDDAR